MVSLGATGEPPELRIMAPLPDAIVTGATRLEATVAVPGDVRTITFFVDGRPVCTVERPPFGCTWQAGDVVRPHHVRVVAILADGTRLVGNVRTKDIGYAEHVRTEAVLVPVIVTDNGRFVRGLKQRDFEIVEDGIVQPIASFASEESPLDLVLAIDISGSMERALGDVKAAVKQLLSKLRPGDAATLLGFNDTTFLVAEREKDRAARERAVDLLASWGGTALYDATSRAIEMVSRERGRKGVIIFSDGDDRDSLTRRETAMARVQASDAMLFTVGFGGGSTIRKLRTSLESYAQATGGRAFFPQSTADIGGSFDEIVADLANQYVLSYSSSNAKQDGKWRNIKVRVRPGKYDVRARLGYRAGGPQQAGR
jgi:VWFA-related protein